MWEAAPDAYVGAVQERARSDAKAVGAAGREESEIGRGAALHFAIPEGTVSITQPDWNGEGHDSWEEWRVDKEKVTSVTFPTTLTSFGLCAFRGCTSLKTVAIPQRSWHTTGFMRPSVTSIEESAFHGCRSLTSVTIPSSVTSVGRSAFHGCSSLARVAIPLMVHMYVLNMPVYLPSSVESTRVTQLFAYTR